MIFAVPVTVKEESFVCPTLPLKVVSVAVMFRVCEPSVLASTVESNVIVPVVDVPLDDVNVVSPLNKTVPV